MRLLHRVRAGSCMHGRGGGGCSVVAGGGGCSVVAHQCAVQACAAPSVHCRLCSPAVPLLAPSSCCRFCHRRACWRPLPPRSRAACWSRRPPTTSPASIWPTWCGRWPRSSTTRVRVCVWSVCLCGRVGRWVGGQVAHWRACRRLKLQAAAGCSADHATIAWCLWTAQQRLNRLASSAAPPVSRQALAAVAGRRAGEPRRPVQPAGGVQQR